MRIHPDIFLDITILDHLASSLSYDEDLVVYWGIGQKVNRTYDNFVDNVMQRRNGQFHYLTSTSLSQRIANQHFCLDKHGRCGTYNIKILIPKGVQCFYLAPYSSCPKEQEVLLPIGTTYRVQNVSGKSVHIALTEISKKQAITLLPLEETIRMKSQLDVDDPDNNKQLFVTSEEYLFKL